MTLFENIEQYEAKVMELICSDEEIIKLIRNKEKDINVPDKDLRYNFVFPYPHVPITTTDANTYITYGISFKSLDKTYKQMSLTIYCFCHKSVMRMKDGKRTSKILKQLDRLFNGSSSATTNLGLGTMELISVDQFSPVENFYGVVVKYQCNDFNRVTNNITRNMRNNEF